MTEPPRKTPFFKPVSNSRMVLEMSAVDESFDVYRSEVFRECFLATLTGQARGALTPFLFHDINPAADDLSQNAAIILSGAQAWERHIADTASETSGKGRSEWKGDREVIRYALRVGLLDLLPQTVKFVSYGAGDRIAFSTKEGQIMTALQQDDRQISHFAAVDILERYAVEAALSARRQFRIRSFSAVTGDFVSNARLALRETAGHPVVTIFGGTFENTPDADDGIDLETRAAIPWAQMNMQHDYKGHTVIKTFDSNQDAAEQIEKYAPTRNFEAFILSAFARAAENGLIDGDYDVFGNWRLKTEFNQSSKSVELRAECKQNHVVKSRFLPNGEMVFHAGSDSIEADSRVVTYSHKWDLETHRRIAKRAGYDIQEFVQPGNPAVLVAATAVAPPDPDLKKLIFG